MLFQGTEKYPRENEYSEFISNNGGYENAYTSLTDTNYRFDCSNEAFEEALDRLAQFFICPNFSENSAEREINAVDSEFSQSLQHDGWHFYALTQSLADPVSNYNRFSCGNLKSLSSPTLREDLLNFHRRWYSANLTTLCITGKFDLATLEKWVTEKFSPIVNKDLVVPPLGDPTPYPADRLSKLVKYVPVKDRDTLTLAFVLPYCGNEFQTQPLAYLSALVGHEGENSLLSFLKFEDLALELSAGPSHCLDCLTTFEIEVTLTKNGLQNWERVLEVAFKYFNTIREAGPQEFFFNECRQIGEIAFKFAEKSEAVEAVADLAERMHQFTDQNIDQLERSKYVVDVFDKDAIQKYADLLVKPEHLNVFLKSKSFSGQTDQAAAWYDTKYSVTDIPADLVAKMTNPLVEENKGIRLGLPPPNPFIPKN